MFCVWGQARLPFFWFHTLGGRGVLSGGDDEDEDHFLRECNLVPPLFLGIA